MNKYKFRVQLLEEVDIFLASLDKKSRDKILYNIWKARSTNDKELFKKLQDEIWGNSEQSLINLIFGFLPFGIKQIEMILL
ncbi:hypothetical protein [Halpernia sp.]|uniref:hypothetical protein n=1 Tax=Halpernia sp. TaxID=2782209 RepID=UPI003A94EA16